MYEKTINVTKYFIKKGERGAVNRCPVALAIQQATGKKCRLSVFSHRIHGYTPVVAEPVQVMQAPAKVSRFIRDFDFYQPVKPFSFVLRMSNKNAKKLGLLK